MNEDMKAKLRELDYFKKMLAGKQDRLNDAYENDNHTAISKYMSEAVAKAVEGGIPESDAKDCVSDFIRTDYAKAKGWNDEYSDAFLKDVKWTYNAKAAEQQKEAEAEETEADKNLSGEREETEDTVPDDRQPEDKESEKKRQKAENESAEAKAKADAAKYNAQAQATAKAENSKVRDELDAMFAQYHASGALTDEQYAFSRRMSAIAGIVHNSAMDAKYTGRISDYLTGVQQTTIRGRAAAAALDKQARKRVHLIKKVEKMRTAFLSDMVKEIEETKKEEHDASKERRAEAKQRRGSRNPVPRDEFTSNVSVNLAKSADDTREELAKAIETNKTHRYTKEEAKSRAAETVNPQLDNASDSKGFGAFMKSAGGKIKGVALGIGGFFAAKFAKDKAAEAQADMPADSEAISAAEQLRADRKDEAGKAIDGAISAIDAEKKAQEDFKQFLMQQGVIDEDDELDLTLLQLDETAESEYSKRIAEAIKDLSSYGSQRDTLNAIKDKIDNIDTSMHIDEESDKDTADEAWADHKQDMETFDRYITYAEKIAGKAGNTAADFEKLKLELESYMEEIRKNAAQQQADETNPDETNPDEPEFDEPEFDEPEFDEPEFDEPEFDESESDEPESDELKPETSEPDEPKPETSESDEPKPETPEPDEPKPDESKPETPEPETSEPDEPEPDEPKPDEPKPETPKPETPKPETPKPEMPEPDGQPTTREAMQGDAPAPQGERPSRGSRMDDLKKQGDEINENDHGGRSDENNGVSK